MVASGTRVIWWFYWSFTYINRLRLPNLLLGLQTMIPSQQPSYQSVMGVQQPQNPALLNSQRAGMGGQMQSIMVQYTQMPSYQVRTVPLCCINFINLYF